MPGTKGRHAAPVREDPRDISELAAALAGSSERARRMLAEYEKAMAGGGTRESQGWLAAIYHELRAENEKDRLALEAATRGQAVIQAAYDRGRRDLIAEIEASRRAWKRRKRRDQDPPGAVLRLVRSVVPVPAAIAAAKAASGGHPVYHAVRGVSPNAVRPAPAST